MAEVLADRGVLADVVPVVVDRPLEERAEDVLARFATDHHGRLQRLRRRGVEPGVGRLRDLPPGFPDLAQ